MLEKAFDKDSMSKARVYEWYKYIQDGSDDIKHDKRNGRPTTSTTKPDMEKVKDIMLSN